MTFSEDTIMVPKGTRLLTRRWGADRPRAEIVIVHGFAEHSGRYTALAEHLMAHSYNVTAYDQRGHGQSDGLAGHIDRFSTYEDDLNCLIGTIRAKSG
ncbi:MAG: alpha/beta fold hydrolase, partial [Blastocatellia bacterium]